MVHSVLIVYLLRASGMGVGSALFDRVAGRGARTNQKPIGVYNFARSNHPKSILWKTGCSTHAKEDQSVAGNSIDRFSEACTGHHSTTKGNKGKGRDRKRKLILGSYHNNRTIQKPETREAVVHDSKIRDLSRKWRRKGRCSGTGRFLRMTKRSRTTFRKAARAIKNKRRKN